MFELPPLEDLEQRAALHFVDVERVGEDLRRSRGAARHAAASWRSRASSRHDNLTTRTMFTGIVAAVGRIERVDPLARRTGVRLTVDAGALGLADVAIGDSIAIQGACMTGGLDRRRTASPSTCRARAWTTPWGWTRPAR